jgi:hypothetical protein
VSRPLRAEERELARQLRLVVAELKPWKDAVYSGPRDFVLRHGQWYQPTADHPFAQGLPSHCFGNAINLAATVADMRYVEGYAINDIVGLPIHHAWVTRGDGIAIDVTWGAFDNATERQLAPLPGAAYLGVEFHFGRADDATWNGDATVLDDWRRDYPLLREPWQGEDWEREWPPTKRLLALQAKVAGDHLEAFRLLREMEAEIAAEAGR